MPISAPGTPWLCLLALLYTADLPCQQKRTEKRFSATQVRQDLETLRSTLEEGHGAAYMYVSRARLSERFAAVKASITTPLSELEALRRIAALVAELNDGHTTARPSRALRAELDAAPIWFPFRVRILRRQIYLFPYRSDASAVPRGSRLVKINGVSASTALADILAMIPSDGWIETSKLRALEGPRGFSSACHLRFGLKESVKVVVQPPTEPTARSMRIDGWQWADVLAADRKLARSPARTLDIESGVAVLRIRSFAPREAASSFADFLTKAFTRLRKEKASGLVIDLRGNGGGRDDFGKILLSHLARGPFDYYKHLEVRARSFDFLKHTNARGKAPPKGALQENERGTSYLRRHPNLGRQAAKGAGFGGKLVLLMDGGSFSTTSEFLACAQENLDAEFVGEEAGGTHAGNTSGMVPILTLPHTKIEVRIPLVRYVLAVKTPLSGRGTMPNYPVEPTIQDILERRDPQLRLARRLASRGR